MSFPTALSAGDRTPFPGWNDVRDQRLPGRASHKSSPTNSASSKTPSYTKREEENG